MELKKPLSNEFLYDDFADEPYDYENTAGSPFKKIPSEIEKSKLLNRGSAFSWYQYWELYALFMCIGVILPKQKRWWVLIVPIQLLILVGACFENAFSIDQSAEAIEKTTEISHIIRCVTAYGWMIYYLKRSHLKELLRGNYRYYLKPESRTITSTQRVVRNYVFICLAMTGLVSSGVYLTIQRLDLGQYRLLLLIALTTSRILFSLIWSCSITLLFITLHMLHNRWSHYLRKLTLGEYESVGAALVTHAKLTEQLSKTNSRYQVYLLSSIACLISSLLSSLYSVIKVSNWMFEFLFDSIFMFMICIPGSRITTLARRVKKKTNKLRALTHPDDTKSIAEIDSFLLYLMCNEASFKFVGVTIDLGFTAKLFLALFSVCAFMIQRELAVPVG